jgi:hypothetical protein
MRFLLAIPIVLVFAGCSKVETSQAPVPSVLPTTTPHVRVDESVTPDKRRVKPWAFETIDQVSVAVEKAPLRNLDLDANDLEIRAWGGFGLTATQGFILNRTAGRWSSVYIRPGFKKIRTREFTAVPLPEPAQSWEIAWQALLKQGILTLPTAEAINCEAMFEDGYSYVIEVKKGENYRTYNYDNPSQKFENRCSQADNILNIARQISEDYGATDFYGG